VIVIGTLGYSAVHKAIPYFAEVPAERFKTWRPANYLPEGGGQGWKFNQYLEDGGALSADVDHFVLQRDGKVYDLINARDTWGFADAASWRIGLTDHQLYVYDAHQEQEPGWYHIDIGKHDWLLPRLGMAPDGSIHAIYPPAGTDIPTDARPSEVFRLNDGHLQRIGPLEDYDDLFEHLKTGDYYLSPPGLGVRKIINLEPTQSGRG
jgi:hypothetical protein